MTDDRHDEIAARLRDEAGARAPDRLRADVMLQVRAEPRVRHIRRRRTYWRPLGGLAAAACIVAAGVVGVNRFEAGGGGSGVGGTAAAGDLGALVESHGNALSASPAPARSIDGRTPKSALYQHMLALGGSSSAAPPRFGDEAVYAPTVLRYTYALRADLAAPLRRAFRPLDGRGTHTSR
jgi:hypothetical protein